MSTPKEKPSRFTSITSVLCKMNKTRVEWCNRPDFQRWFMIVTLSLFIAFLLSPNLLPQNMQYEVGDIAREDIKASHDFLAEDHLPTERRRSEAMQTIPPVYDLDGSLFEQISKKVSLAFNLMREKAIPAEQRKQDFETLLGISNLPEEVFSSLEKRHFAATIEEGIISLVDDAVRQKRVVASKTAINLNYPNITIRNASSPGSAEHIVHIGSIFDLGEIQTYIENRANLPKGRFSSRERRSMVILSQRLIQPNLSFNQKETEERRHEARLSVPPVYLQVKKGEIIVRGGERVQQAHLIKLKGEQRASRQANTLSILLGSALISAIILVVLYKSTLKRLRPFAANNKNLLFLCILLAFIILGSKVSLFIVKAVGLAIPHLDPATLLYALPVASGAMLVGVFFASNVALIFSLPTAILAALLLSNTLEFFIYFLVGSIIASRNISQFKERGNVLRAGIMVGLAQALLVIAFNLSAGSFFTLRTIEGLFAALLGGCLLGVIVIGLIPIVEILFGYTTNLKLLELASLDHPLLQELMVQAPGTYHHSVIVGSMVESAARTIGANPLLAKVSAYYHDIGKIKKPAYFIENQMGRENKHEKLAPSMSSLILISHVKDGVESARRHKLGPEMIDIIRQHHGTSLIAYFYEKAKGMENPGQSPVRMEDFRYPGPIPQTKEAGLVMLADAVEATSRTIDDPSLARIKGMVQKIINNIFADGQLNDCELTLKDMHQIAKSFTHVLMGISHQRIEYPESAVKDNGEKNTDADSDQQQTKGDKDRLAKDKRKSGETLRRLGSA